MFNNPGGGQAELLASGSKLWDRCPYLVGTLNLCRQSVSLSGEKWGHVISEGSKPPMSTLGYYKPTLGVPSKELKHYVERQASMEIRTGWTGSAWAAFPTCNHSSLCWKFRVSLGRTWDLMARGSFNNTAWTNHFPLGRKEAVQLASSHTSRPEHLKTTMSLSHQSMAPGSAALERGQSTCIFNNFLTW